MTQPAPVPSVAPTPVALVPARRVGWASDYLQRLMPEANKPTAPTTAAPATGVTHWQAAGRAIGDVATVGVTSGLLGAAHARGLLDQGKAALDGLLALIGIGIGVGSAPYAPGFSRFSTNLGLAGVGSLMFRKGFQLAGGGAQTSPPAPPPTSRVAVDPIATAAEGLEV